MFLGRRAWSGPGKGGALTGPVTLPGEPAGAWIEGERRGVAVYAPGGYHWVPALGDEVLVLKAGESGEAACAVGVAAGGKGLKPGEVLITAGASSLKLGLDGRVELTGRVEIAGSLSINGIPVDPLAGRDKEGE